MKTLNGFILVALLSFPAPALAQTTVAQTTQAKAPATIPAAAETIKVTNAYCFAVAGEGRPAAVFLTLSYPAGDTTLPNRLIGAKTPVADKAELHTMMVENNVMTMRPLESLPLPPTGHFMLKPQGVHLMLTGLHQSLKTGDKFPITLLFAAGGTVTADVTVRPLGDVPPAAGVEKPAGGAIPEPPEEKAIHQEMMMDGTMNAMPHTAAP